MKIIKIIYNYINILKYIKFLLFKYKNMWIKVEFNPDLALRNIENFKNWERKIEECIPENLKKWEIYNFLKKDQRNYFLLWEIPLLETKWNEILSRPRASIIILEATHFAENNTLYTKWKYKVIEVFSDDKIYFESYERVWIRK